jgi:hypothetical protein
VHDNHAVIQTVNSLRNRLKPDVIQLLELVMLINIVMENLVRVRQQDLQSLEPFALIHMLLRERVTVVSVILGVAGAEQLIQPTTSVQTDNITNPLKFAYSSSVPPLLSKAVLV